MIFDARQHSMIQQQIQVMMVSIHVSRVIQTTSARIHKRLVSSDIILVVFVLEGCEEMETGNFSFSILSHI